MGKQTKKTTREMKRTILIKIVFRQFYGCRLFLFCRFFASLCFVLIASYCFSIIFMPSSTACMLSGMRP